MTHWGVGYLSFGFHHYPESPGVVGKAHRVQICDCEHEHICAFTAVDVYSKITLDTEWVKVLPVEKVRQVILHEIAHAITPIIPGMNPHGAEWKKNCIKVGTPPERLFKSHIVPKTLKDFEKNIGIENISNGLKNLHSTP